MNHHYTQRSGRLSTLALSLAVAWSAVLIVLAATWHRPSGTTITGITSSGVHYVHHLPPHTLLQSAGVTGILGASIPLLVALLVIYCLKWRAPEYAPIMLAIAWVLSGGLLLAGVLAAFAYGPFIVPTALLLGVGSALGDGSKG